MRDTTPEELAALAQLAGALNEATTLESALEVALEHLTERFGLRTGWIWLREDTGDEVYVLAAARDLPDAFVEDAGWTCGSCTCLGEFGSGALDAPKNTAVLRCSRLSSVPGETNGLGFHISVPLRTPRAALGVLNLASATWRELSPRELGVMGIVGELLATTIERAKATRKVADRAAWSERVRVARDLHDTVVQHLVALTMNLETIQAVTDPEASTQPMLGAAIDLARRSLDDARASVLEMREDQLEGRSLPDALDALCAHKFTGRPERVSLEVTGPHAALDGRRRLGLYRITQEALSNVARHANASVVCVRLEVDASGDARLTIDDDGDAPDPLGAEPGGVGLIGMRERARLMGGSLEVRERAGGGVRVSALAPAPDATEGS